ncbi:hypothetical protein HJC23_001591 [Cyclotella cryptica]|uniref:Uncharacterized protein n=1 Tax=Cyclotella cryptica TaxID=29204 RepID=A0ABD3P0A5_9STRA|eukprot:CCRYP_018820-RA/>CCRYP_018820-RA protein AED:0.34 eAED:0.34 QI:0/-1/0/1/-1/1/1/0/184
MPFSSKPGTNTVSPKNALICDWSRKGNSLLQDWPHNDSALHGSKKKVTFAEYSELRLYSNDKWYQSKKSYTSAEVKKFRDQAALDASRIRNLISLCPAQNGCAISHAMDAGLLKHDELLGIEHLVSEKAAANALYERKAHVALTLRAQEVMQRKYDNTVNDVWLAKVARRLSSRSVKRARIRAA